MSYITEIKTDEALIIDEKTVITAKNRVTLFVNTLEGNEKARIKKVKRNVNKSE